MQSPTLTSTHLLNLSNMEICVEPSSGTSKSFREPWASYEIVYPLGFSVSRLLLEVGNGENVFSLGGDSHPQ